MLFRIRDIECRISPVTVIEENEVDDIAVDKAIDDIAKCAAEYERETGREHPVIPRREPPLPPEDRGAHDERSLDRGTHQGHLGTMGDAAKPSTRPLTVTPEIASRRRPRRRFRSGVARRAHGARRRRRSPQRRRGAT